MMNEPQQSLHTITRRTFLGKFGAGVGAAALATLLQEQGYAASVPAFPNFLPSAKNVIYIHLAGSPPQQDLFDFKPKLKEYDGKPCPEDMLEKERFAFIKGHPNILASPYEFQQYGQSGMWVSELLPHFATIADDVTVIRSLHTDQFNHAPAQLFLYTGSPRLGRPSMGSWITYGLGTENKNLPGFVVLVSGNKTPDGGTSLWGTGFLPTIHQGVQCRTQGEPVLYVTNPEGMDREMRRDSLDTLKALNELQYDEARDPETLTRISQYELAYRMQLSVPEVMDISREPQHIIDAYGAAPGTASFANNCLLARRLVEQGTRFVQLFDWGWDTHGTSPGDDIVTHLPNKCKIMDQPVAALVKDLKQRGLLDETLVVWSGEFGRTAMNEARGGSKFLGRDHHPHCFTMWMAGGGVKRGAVVGETDELGYRIAQDPIHIHDLQATILHLLGINHEHLTFRFQGRDYRLTDVHGKVAKQVLA